MIDKLIDTAIAISKVNRMQIGIEKNNYHYVQYMLDFATISINVGRRTGKTYYINSRATSEDLIIRPEHYERHNTYCPATVLNIHKLRETFRGRYYGNKNFSTMYIDEPDFALRGSSLVEVLETLYMSNIMVDIVVMLGTAYGRT